MSTDTGNTQAKKEHRGSDNPNMKLQKQELRDPNHSDGRDKTGRKGGDNAEAL